MRWKGPLKSCISRRSDRSEHGSCRTRHHRRLATRTPVDPVLAAPRVTSGAARHHDCPPRTPVAQLPRLQELPPEPGRHPASRRKHRSPGACVLRSFLLSRVAISGDVREFYPRAGGRRKGLEQPISRFFWTLGDVHRTIVFSPRLTAVVHVLSTSSSTPMHYSSEPVAPAGEAPLLRVSRFGQSHQAAFHCERYRRRPVVDAELRVDVQ
jgi:hypothetical protein